MKGIQTIKLSEDAVSEALTDYLNKHVVHQGTIVVGMISFGSCSRLEVEFEDKLPPSTVPKKGEPGWQGSEPYQLVNAGLPSGAESGKGAGQVQSDTSKGPPVLQPPATPATRR